MTKFLIGTMYVDEQEFPACVQAIHSQSGVEVEHVVVEGLSHQAAHEKLYSTFMQRAADVDYFMKVDADMVLCRSTFCHEVATWFAAHPDMKRFTIWVHDFFPDRLVRGLHSWRNDVRWPATVDKVVADADVVGRECSFEDQTELAPAAWHCPDASPFQAYHYGLIRAVKVVRAMQLGWFHGFLLRDTWKHLQKRWQDRRLLLACLGGEDVYRGRFGADDLDYQCSRTREACATWNAMDSESLYRELRLRHACHRLRYPGLFLAESGRVGTALRLPQLFPKGAAEHV